MMRAVFHPAGTRGAGTGLRMVAPAILLLISGCGTAQAQCMTKPRLELNIEGYQSDFQPARHADRLNNEYVLPSDETLAYFRSKGITVFRLPVKWERMQPRVNGPLDVAKVAELKAYLDHVDSLGARFIPDLHNFGRYNGRPLGTPEVPTAALASFWGQFAKLFRGRFAGYDLMNEPYEMPSADIWPKAAQLAVDAIRKVDRKTTVYVEGDDWANGERWQRSNADLDVKDPTGRLVYSAHQYFDADTSGQYHKMLADDGVSLNIGAKRIQPFIAWLRARKARGHIGEFGIPRADRGWEPVLDQFLAAVWKNCDVIEGLSYWAAGDWSDVDAMTIQPVWGKDGGPPVERLQIKVLEKWISPEQKEAAASTPRPRPYPPEK